MADLLSTGISGVRTYQRALATVGNNIANVDTEGYSRQRVEIAQNVSSSEGSLNIGNGARAVRVQRSYDNFVVENLRSSQSQLNKHQATLEYVTQLENILADKQLSLSTSMDGFFAAVQEVSISPSSVAARQNMLNVAETTVAQFTSVGTQLSLIEENSYSDLTGQVNSLNQLAEQLGSVNASLNRVNSIDKQPNELLDRRDTLIKDMSKLLRVHAVEKDNGSVDIHIGDVASGQYLVKGKKASTLGIDRSTTNADKAVLMLDPFMSPQKVTQVVGGSIAGISEFRQNSLTIVRDELDSLTQVFVGQVNNTHALGIDAQGNFGNDLFSLGNIYSVTPGLNKGTGFVSVSAVPNAKVDKLTMELSYSDSTKAWTLTDTVSKTTVTGASELTMGGVKFTLTGVPKEGDTFRLTSTRRPIDALQVVVTEHSNIASGGAVSVARATTNTRGTKMILNGYAKPPVAVADTTMGDTLRNNISQGSRSIITPSNNAAFVIPANTQNSQFYSTATAANFEVDTYTLGAAIASGGNASLQYGGVTYSQAFSTDAATTMTGLVAAINGGAAGSTVTAAMVNSKVFTITKDNGSFTQMIKGTITGTSNGTAPLTFETEDTATGRATSTAQMQVFTREGKQLFGSTLSSSEQTALVTSGNGFSATAAYDSTYNNQTGSNAYMDANVTVTNTNTTPVQATVTMTISGSAIKASDEMVMKAGEASYTHIFTSDGDQTTSAAAYVAAWNASADANLSLYTASSSEGTITITENAASNGVLAIAGQVIPVGDDSDIVLATAASAGTTGVKGGDSRDYFALAGSLKEDLLVFVRGVGSAEVSGQWGNMAEVDVREQLRQNIDIQFAADASSYILNDTTTNTNIASGTYTAGSTIEHNGWTMSFDAPIQANDKFSVRGNSAQAGDNRNLLKLIELQDNKDIFSGRGDFTEVYTDVIGDLGYNVVQSAVSRDAQQIIFDQAQAKRDEISAVSLDEEAANLLRFQQAYQASAQIISTATKLFDTILGIR